MPALEEHGDDQRQQPDAQQRRPEEAGRDHDPARRQETRFPAQPQHQQRRQPAADEVLGIDCEEIHVGQVLQEQRTRRRRRGCGAADVVCVVRHPLRAGRRVHEPQTVDAEMRHEAPRRIRHAVAQHVLQHVHAAEEHEHRRRQQHGPQGRQTLRAQADDQRDAAPGPQRHRPVQRTCAQPLAGESGHDVVAEVVAQQRWFVAQIVRQVRGPLAPRQGEENPSVGWRVEAVRVENPESGQNVPQISANSDRATAASPIGNRQEPQSIRHRPAQTSATAGMPNHHSNQPRSQTPTGSSR